VTVQRLYWRKDGGQEVVRVPGKLDQEKALDPVVSKG